MQSTVPVGRCSFPVPIAPQGQTHTHKGSAGAQSEQLGRNTPDLYSDERDSNIRDRREHEDQGPGVQQLSETAVEHTSGGDHDLVQSGGSGGGSWCSGYTTVRIDRCH